MFLIIHLKLLWNAGLPPASADPVRLRERRTLSTTIFFVLPVAIGLIVSNYYTGVERDNVYIAIATVVVFLGLYLKAYFNQQLLASQIPLAAYWVVMCLTMTSVGVWANTWAWLLCLPAIGFLVAGRIAGVVWTVIYILTLWVFAYMQYSGYEFPFSGPMEGDRALTLAFEASLVVVMLYSAAFVFRNAQTTAEKKLSDTVKELEKVVHDRTFAENEARQSKQAKASFLAAMNHELRTPLNGVIGASQLLMDGAE